MKIYWALTMKMFLSSFFPAIGMKSRAAAFEGPRLEFLLWKKKRRLEEARETQENEDISRKTYIHRTFYNEDENITIKLLCCDNNLRI
jgi:hypothetical protein